MIYIHFCKKCTHLHMLNGHKLSCPKCNEALTELKILYMDYISMDLDERAILLEQCKDESALSELSTVYRMYKYSKAYKRLLEDESVSQIIDKTEPPLQE